MNTITEIPGVELAVPRPTGNPVVTPHEKAPVGRPATHRGVLIILGLCSVLFAAMLIARVLIPAAHTVTSASDQDYQQAP